MSGNGEFQKFLVDQDAMVRHMIHSQNGTASTGIRELVMNCVDGGATRIEIVLSEIGFRVCDNGRGIQTAEDVRNHFRRFGTPHEEGDALFGRFRIGRGQMMSLAKCQWHTNEFRIVTDIQGKGYGMELFVEPDNRLDGCEVSGTFYRPLTSYQLLETKEEIVGLVKYLDVPVYLNGERLNDLDGIDWGYEDDDVRILWEPAGEQGIHLFSLGVYVKDLDINNYGISAHVVTKKAFDLNMARNEIAQGDSLLHKVQELIRAKGQEKIKRESKSGKYTESSRNVLIRNQKKGDTKLSEVMHATLLKDYSGRYIRLAELEKAALKGKPVCLMPEGGEHKADRLAIEDKALVLSRDTLTLWGCTELDQLIQILVNGMDEASQDRWLEALTIAEFEDLASHLSDEFIEYPEKSLSPELAAGLMAAKAVSKSMAEWLSKTQGERVLRRQVAVGRSDVADGWTDGHSKIVIHEKVLKGSIRRAEGADEVVALLLHEYGHDAPNDKGHEHDFDFYKAFHDAIGYDGMSGRFAEQYRRRLIGSLSQYLIRVPAWAHKSYDLDKLITTKVERTGDRVSKLAKILMDVTGAAVSVGAKTVTLDFETVRTGHIPEKLSTRLAKEMRKDGFIVHSTKEAGDVAHRFAQEQCKAAGYSQFDAHDKKTELHVQAREHKLTELAEEFRKSLHVWMAQHEQDGTLVEPMIRLIDGGRWLRREMVMQSVLQLLVKDRASDFGEYRYSRKVEVEVSGSANYHLEATQAQQEDLAPHDNVHKLKTEGLQLAEDKDRRMMAAKKKISQALDLLTDPSERKELAQALLNEQWQGLL